MRVIAVRRAAHPPEYAQRGEDPPRVAHVRLLLGAPVQPARVALPLRQPPAEQVLVHEVQRVSDGQRAHAAEDLARMRLRTRHCAETSIEVTTTAEKFHKTIL